MTGLPQSRRPGRGLPVLVLVAGLAVGAAVGLAVSWWLWPVEYVDVAPYSLNAAHRQEYIVLIGQAFAHDRDPALAQARLANLGDPAAVGIEVAALAEELVAVGGRVEYIRSLTALAYAVGHSRAALAAYLPDATPLATWTPRSTHASTAVPTATPTATTAATPTPTATSTPTTTPTHTATPTPVPTDTPTLTPTATRTPTGVATVSPTASPTLPPTQPSEATRRPVTPTPTGTPRPTYTPTITPVPSPRFELTQQRRTCEEPAGLLRVWVHGADGEPEPNVELLVRWDRGEERFFTGLKPEIGAGYADFAMQKGETYQVGIVTLESDVAQGILADLCVEKGRLASWDVVFRLSAEPTP